MIGQFFAVRLLAVRLCVNGFYVVEQLAAEFLGKYITENVGPFGVIGRMPAGLVGSLAGVPGIGPGGQTVGGINKPELLGGLAGLGIGALFD